MRQLPDVSRQGMDSQVGDKRIDRCQASILGAFEHRSQAAGDAVTHGIDPGVRGHELARSGKRERLLAAASRFLPVCLEYHADA
jgi:hypothetical protein